MGYSIINLSDKVSEVVISGTIIQFNDGVNKHKKILIDPGLNLDVINNKDDLLLGNTLFDKLAEVWTPIIDEIDTIILTQSSIERLGSYAFIFNAFQESIFTKDVNVYATLPIVNLGRLSTIEFYCNKNLMGNYIDHHYELEDIEQSFDYIKPLKYNQTIKITSSQNVNYTCFNAGHSLGSSIIKLQNIEIDNTANNSNNKEEFVLYFSEWSHVVDSITEGTSILDRMNFWNPQHDVMHPSSIITNIDDSYSTEESLAPWGKRTNQFKSYLFDNLSMSNLIVLPVDISTNFLKIFTVVAEFYQEYNKPDSPEEKIFEQFENYSKNFNSMYNANNENNKRNMNGMSNQSNDFKRQKKNVLPPIYLLANSKGRAITYCKSMLEWLDDSLLKNWNKNFQQNSNNNASGIKTPFDQIIQVLTPEDFEAVSKTSILNKKKIAETGGLLFINDDFLLMNEVLDSLNKQEDSEIHVVFTDVKQKGNYKEFLNDNQVINLLIKDNAVVDDEKIVKQLNQQIIDNSEKRKKLQDQYNEKKKLAKEEAAALVYDVRDDEASDSDDDVEGFADDEIDDETQKGSNADEVEKEIENSPYDTVIKPNTSLKHKMFKIKTSTYMRDDYGLIVDFDHLFANDEDIDDVKGEDGHASSVVSTVANEMLTNDIKEELNATASNRNATGFNMLDDEDEELKDAYITISTNHVYDQNGNYFDDLQYLNVLNKKRMFWKTDIKTKNVAFDNLSVKYIDLTSSIDTKSSNIILPFFKAQNYLYINEQTSSLGGIPENIRILNEAKKEYAFETTVKNLNCVLSADLESDLQWENVLNGKYQISKVSCELVKVVNNKTGMTKFKIKPTSSTEEIDQNTSGDLLLGNVTLSSIRNTLVKTGHSAVFLGNGSLLIDNEIYVGKVNSSVVEINGKPTTLYYKVRQMVNGMLASL
ncbi:hypothetical protein ACO0OE_002754 [Hanseniaspora uvarum]